MISVRYAVYSDLKELAELHRRTWTNSHSDIFPSWYIAERPFQFFHGLWEAFLNDDLRPAAVAHTGSRLLGFIRYGRVGSTVEARWKEFGEIHTLYVSPDAQRRGIGSRLLSFGERELSATGSREAILSVSKGRSTAIDFYSKHGWGHCEEYIAQYQGVQLPFLTLKKCLGPDRLDSNEANGIISSRYRA